jgi:hypothetical protein
MCMMMEWDELITLYVVMMELLIPTNTRAGSLVVSDSNSL